MAERPLKDISFPSLKRSEDYKSKIHNEKFVAKVRRHWIIYLPGLLWFSIIFSIGILILIYHNDFTEALNLPSDRWVLIVIILMALAFGTLSRTIIQWLNNYFIITNCRILHFRFKGRVKYEGEELFMETITYVDVNRPGLLAAILDFGHIDVGSGISSKNESILRLGWVPSPHRIMNKINQA